ncbi:MAG TPA: hypothetical protein VIK18_02070 [Pirellulales bacterium]
MIHSTSHPGSPRTTTIQALAIGDRSSRELAGSLALLERSLATSYLPTLSAASARYRTGLAPPDLLVLLQSRGGQFLEGELLRLRSCMPLARAVTVLGSWCEGEMRSGRPLAGVRRVSWYAWPLRLARELSAWQSGGGTWALPPTAAEEELLLEADGLGGQPHQRMHHGPIAVRTAGAAFAACVVEALARYGLAAVFTPSTQPTAAEPFSALVDELRLPADSRQLASLYRLWQPRPIIALADFPRPRDERLACDAGASMLLGMPLDLDELAAHLDRLLEAAASQRK